MFSNCRELHLAEIVQDAEKPEGRTDDAHTSFGSLGNRVHESNDRNHMIKATISRLSINSLPGSDHTLVCAVGEHDGAKQGQLPSIHHSAAVPYEAWVHWCVQEHPAAFQGRGV